MEGRPLADPLRAALRPPCARPAPASSSSPRPAPIRIASPGTTLPCPAVPCLALPCPWGVKVLGSTVLETSENIISDACAEKNA